MLFTTYQFLVFFLITFIIAIFLKRKVVSYKIFLLVTSLIFYSFWNLSFLALLVTTTIVNYLLLQTLFVTNDKQIFLIMGLIFNIGFLGIFKYYNFFTDTLFNLLNTLHVQSNLQLLQIIAPVGVSFYTFRIISHLADCYNQKIDCPSFIDYAVYITYFPQIASGPIARAKEFYLQLNTSDKYEYQIEESMTLILSGLFKKYTLSSFLFNFTQLPFLSPQQYSSIDLSLAAISYSCLIYVDFSGYSDLANGISCLLGFKPIPNFNMPYRALSLQEFWRRWHISLSEWLRDYVYIPLGGNKNGKFSKYINLLLTMLIGGFWHGAGLNFIVWGAIHGLGLIVNHLWQDFSKFVCLTKIPFLSSLAPIFYWVITFCFITCSWIFFNSSSSESAVIFIGGIIHSEVNTFQFNFWQLYLVIAIVGLINFYGNQLNKLFLTVLSVKSLVFQVVLVSLLVYSILMLGPNTVPPFIYFNF